MANWKLSRIAHVSTNVCDHFEGEFGNGKKVQTPDLPILVDVDPRETSAHIKVVHCRSICSYEIGKQKKKKNPHTPK